MSRLLAVYTGVMAVGVLGGSYLWFSPGFFTIDELIYTLMAEAALEGRLVIDNGYQDFQSPLLTLRFLVPGPDGLAPQYPSGYAFLAAPFYWLAGMQGLLLLNALAFVLCLPLTYTLARRLSFSRETAFVAALVLGLGTFAIEYAPAIWPHALSMLLVLLSATWIAGAAQAEGRPAGVLALLAGLVVGGGVTVRADVILIAPALLVWLLLYRPLWRLTVWFCAGLMPGLLLAGWLNLLKFGTWSPFSYGRETGNTAFGSYLPLVLLGLAILLGAALLGHPRSRKLLLGRAGAIVGVALLLVLAGLTPLRELVVQIVKGVYVLAVDLQAYDRVAVDRDVTVGDHGLLLFHDEVKRALAQSLPYVGLMPFAVAGLWRDRNRRAWLLVLIVIVSWMVPFAVRQWHGGLAFNMRYFVPLLPFVALLAAAALQDLWEASAPSGGLRRGLRAGIRIAVVTTGLVVVVVALVTLAPQVGLRLFYYLPLGLALLILLGSIQLVFRAPEARTPRMARAVLALAFAAVVWAGASAVINDLLVTQTTRAHHAARLVEASKLEPEILIVSYTPLPFHPQLQRPGSIVALITSDNVEDAPQLIDHHLGLGRSAYLHDVPQLRDWLAGRIVSAHELEEFEVGELRFTVLRPRED